MDCTPTTFLINFLGMAMLCMVIWLLKQLFLIISIAVKYYRAVEKEINTTD